MKVQSNGMGTQSVAMYLMSSIGVLPRLDHSIFVDTGLEKPNTYKALKWLIEWSTKNNGIPLTVIKQKNLYQDLMKNKGRFASIPAFTETNGSGEVGMLKRQCTGEYKITQVNKQIKKIQGLGKFDRYNDAEVWIGISLEECQRVNSPKITNFKNVFPFCNAESTKENGVNHEMNKYFDNYGITRSEIIKWMNKMGFPDVGRSSCAFCPYMSNSEWAEVKKDPKTWKKVVELDSHIRNSTKKGVQQPIYLTDQLVPINQAYFNEAQVNAFEDCEGYCHI
ncbi:hypothetical protein [Aureibacter tunicatorum]|uniref:3'-phosphoadenosine 5'-phosphosulfate sulfotransferase (PAPS reductase)/FAD synthetase n=1 Tax=Aureibacter tunicatorum TaxID=866807 RepID=A0AAE3XRW6_9BACT|nr:hypothetical protein [Aureibacter tunicatorum]MDR6240953.1 hypothetical protein [Aureibacter tunicatorum]BDD03733.1 hypothetical protein AUTU_12160 [Aureibacter tunicatorum]